MKASMAVPLPLDSYPLPMDPGTLSAVGTVLSMAFMVLAGLAVAWPIMTLVAEALGRTNAQTSLRRLAEWMARRTPGAAVLAMVLGMPVWFISLVLYGKAVLPATLQAGWLWMHLVSLLFLGLGASFWTALRRRGTEPSTIRAFLPDIVESYILAFRRRGLERPGLWMTSISAVAFLAVGFILVAHGVLVENPAKWGPSARPPEGWLVLWSNPLLAGRLAHSLLAALSIGGMAVAVHGADRIAGGEGAYGRIALRFGAAFFAVPVALQGAAGPWLVSGLGAGEMAGAGVHSGGGWLVWGSASLGFLSAVLVALAAGMRRPRLLARVSAGLFALALFGMVVLARSVSAQRLSSYLGPAEKAAAHPVAVTLATVLAVSVVGALTWMALVSRIQPGQDEEGE